MATTHSSKRTRVAFLVTISAIAALAALPGFADTGVAESADLSSVVIARPRPIQIAVAPCPTDTVVAATPAPACPPVARLADDDTRHSMFALYGWLAGVNGDLTAGPLTASVDVSFSDLLKNLDMTFMGYYETSKGRMGFYLDTIYVRVSGDVERPLTTVGYRVSETLAEGGVLFPGGTAERGLDGFVGARYLGVSNRLSLTPPGVSGSASNHWLQPVIGGRYRTTFSERWSGTLRGDIGGTGGGGNSSWQALVTLRYRLNEKTSLGIGYRYLHMNLEKGRFGFDGATRGPLVGVGWEM